MSFDRVASIYDATRAVPDAVVEQVTDRVLAATQAGPETRFLELGIGTGRIALPFIRRGLAYTGVDISHGMLAQLRAKVPGADNLTLLEADITDLPLPDGGVDVVLFVHVLHLVPGWREALREARRVLRPEGYIVMGQDTSLPGDPGHDIRGQWRTFVEETGTSLRPPYGTWRAVDAELTDWGCRTAVYRVDRWEGELRPIDLIESHRDRTFSLSWTVPDEVLDPVHERLLAWARQRYGDVRRPLPTAEEFTLSVSRLPPEPAEADRSLP